MTGGQQLVRVVVAPLVIIMFIGVGMALFGSGVVLRLSTVVSVGGSTLWMLGVIWWIALVDSRKRWPDVHWSQRFTRVLTFHRDAEEEA